MAMTTPPHHTTALDGQATTSSVLPSRPRLEPRPIRPTEPEPTASSSKAPRRQMCPPAPASSSPRSAYVSLASQQSLRSPPASLIAFLSEMHDVIADLIAPCHLTMVSEGGGEGKTAIEPRPCRALNQLARKSLLRS
ncbi:hypothetical protein LZ31DRAFT_156832 [Colletotrichum somersetense]|nr:hypothetical protein LZ31DRAFT_156832 [Colletotrichum somersetense]